jgi:hypothetical protein
VLADVPKHKKAVMSLPENIGVLNQLCSGLGYGAVDCEFNINQSMIYVK